MRENLKPNHPLACQASTAGLKPTSLLETRCGSLYTLAFPLIILLCIAIRIYGELENYEALGVSLVPSFVSYLLVGTSTVLYIGKLHGSSLRKLLTIPSSGLRKMLRILRIR